MFNRHHISKHRFLINIQRFLIGWINISMNAPLDLDNNLMNNWWVGQSSRKLCPSVPIHHCPLAHAQIFTKTRPPMKVHNTKEFDLLFDIISNRFTPYLTRTFHKNTKIYQHQYTHILSTHRSIWCNLIGLLRNDVFT